MKTICRLVLATAPALAVWTMATEPATTPTPPAPADSVVVRRIDAKTGALGPAAATRKVVKTDAEWRKLLTPEQYRVTRHAATEPPFCGAFFDHKKPGRYDCVGCALPLFKADAKFDSGTGWPSFTRPIAAENIVTRRDTSHGMIREEILCALCDAHLGHVFTDGPKPGGLRYCLNSAALHFVPDAPAVKPGGKTDH